MPDQRPKASLVLPNVFCHRLALEAWHSHFSRVLRRSLSCRACLQAAVTVANAKESSILKRMKLAGFQSSRKMEALRQRSSAQMPKGPSFS